MRARVKKDTQALLQAFSSLAQVSNSMERAYSDLQRKVKRLSRQLEDSNRYLSSLLQSLPCGILVMKDDVVGTLNKQAKSLLSLSDVSPPCRWMQLLEGNPYAEKLAVMFRSGMKPGELSVGDDDPKILSFSWAHMSNRERVLVIQDVTEIRALEKQMHKSQELTAMGEMAVELAHEIRNPLAGLELFASLLREEGLPTEERQRYLDNVQIGIRSLNTVVTNMLCFSGKPAPRKEPVVLAQLLEEIATVMAVLVKQRGILLLDDYQDRREVMADREMLRQVFTNLMLNAMQALPEGGRIELRTASRRNQVAVTIRDNGIGIPEELQKVIFEPRFTTNPKGQGLGLSIVKRIMKVHEGHIELKTHKGWGTQFILIFPVGCLSQEPSSSSEPDAQRTRRATELPAGTLSRLTHCKKVRPQDSAPGVNHV